MPIDVEVRGDGRFDLVVEVGVLGWTVVELRSQAIGR